MTPLDVPSSAWLVDLLVPEHCTACGAAGRGLCAECVCALRPLRPPCCALCGAPTAWPVERCRECAGRTLAFASARAAVVYGGPARPFVRAWKERGLRRAADLAVALVVEHVAPPTADVITYIPPDADRLLRRGAHPAEALARGLGAAWGIETCGLLARRGAARGQTGLDRRARFRNAREAFVARERPPAQVVVVDDVYTTGATATAAAHALRQAGALRVDTVTFARTVR